MENNIVEELRKTNSFSNRMLAKNIEKVSNSTTWSLRREGRISDNNNKKAYDLFLKLVTPECKKTLEELDTAINSIVTNIEKKTGWFMSPVDNSFSCYDNFENDNDYEFRSRNSYHLRRTEQGYDIHEKEPYNEYFEGIKKVELEFLKKHEEELKLLHEALSKKESIMLNDFVLKDNNNLNLACEISKFLGFKDKSQKVNKTK